MAFDYWNPNSGEAPWWAQEWNANAFRQLQQQAGFDPGYGSAASLKDGGDSSQRQNFFNYLANNGMQLGHQLNGRQGQYQVLDAQGNAVANEGFDPGGMMDMALPVLMAVGANYLVGGSGLGAGLEGAAAGAEGGIGTLGAGGTSVAPLGSAWSPSALGITELGASAVSAGDLAALSAALPSLPATAGAVGGSSAASALGSADKAAMFGSEGYGAGMTGAQTGAYDSVLGATGSKGLADIAGTVAGVPGVSNLSNLLPSSGSGWASLLGGLMGAADAGKPNTATTQSQIDPRMAQYLYGTGYGDTNSLLGAAQAQFKANPTGINPTMQQGLDMSKAALSDPAYSQAFQQMRTAGNGLLNTPAAGNPFAGGQMPSMQAGGLLPDPNRAQALMARGRGLLG